MKLTRTLIDVSEITQLLEHCHQEDRASDSGVLLEQENASH